MNEQSEQFKRKLSALTEIIESLPRTIMKSNSTTEMIVNDINNSIKHLSTQLHDDNNALNAGGKFEWVDSTFVKVIY